MFAILTCTLIAYNAMQVVLSLREVTADIHLLMRADTLAAKPVAPDRSLSGAFLVVSLIGVKGLSKWELL